MNKILVSFCLFTYNQAAFVAEAVKSALSQEYDDLEIIISDDCSSDETFEIIQSVTNCYTGKHKLILLRNDYNMGLVPHINKVLFNHTHGKYIILAAGDDVSLPHRTKLTVKALSKDTVVGVVFPVVKINKIGGIIDNPRKKYNHIYKLNASYLRKSSFMVYGTGLSFIREVMEVFGKLNDSCPTEDSTFRLRCLLMGRILLMGDSCMYYRIHDNNMSSPGNIYTLKTKCIAEQYFTDIETAFNSKLISEKKRVCLLKKVSKYVRYRELCQLAYDRNDFVSKIRLYWLNLLYRFI